MCDETQRRVHTVRFSETPERIDLSDMRTTYRSRASSSRRGILSNTRLMSPGGFEQHYHPTEEEGTVRSSSLPTTSIALVHKDSIELMVKRGFSMTSKCSGSGFLRADDEDTPSPSKWKMRLWMPRPHDDDGFDTRQGQSKKGTGFLELFFGSKRPDTALDTAMEHEASSDMSSYPEQHDGGNCISEEQEAASDDNPDITD